MSQSYKCHCYKIFILFDVKRIALYCTYLTVMLKSYGIRNVDHNIIRFFFTKGFLCCNVTMCLICTFNFLFVV